MAEQKPHVHSFVRQSSAAEAVVEVSVENKILDFLNILPKSLMLIFIS